MIRTMYSGKRSIAPYLSKYKLKAETINTMEFIPQFGRLKQCPCVNITIEQLEGKFVSKCSPRDCLPQELLSESKNFKALATIESVIMMVITLK
jgi:hypothetical protein